MNIKSIGVALQGDITSLLDLFLQNNSSLDIKTIPLNHSLYINGLQWKNLLEQKVEIINLLKKYQRVLRVVDSDAIARQLLERGVHSAYQIAALSEQEFLQQHADIFPDTQTASAAYAKALRRRTQVFLHHLNKQEQESPYVKASRFFN